MVKQHKQYNNKATVTNEDSNTEEVKEEVNNINQNHSLTPEERALTDRIASDDSDWQTITEDDLNDFSLREDPYKLPPEAVKKQADKEFAFRWVEKKPERIDQVRSLDPPARWWVCNRTSTPFLARHCDPVHGGIQKLDQILMFKPYWMFEKHQNAKMQIAEAKTGAGDIANRDGEVRDWGEWRSGPEHRISNADVVMADDAVADGMSE